MRLHTDILTEHDIYVALNSAASRGTVAAHVDADITEHRSQSRSRAYEVRLSTSVKVPGDKRRLANSGNRGAGTDYAATYDEWGYFIAELYAQDENMKFGPYTDRLHFHAVTRYAYTDSEG